MIQLWLLVNRGLREPPPRCESLLCVPGTRGLCRKCLLWYTGISPALQSLTMPRCSSPPRHRRCARSSAISPPISQVIWKSQDTYWSSSLGVLIPSPPNVGLLGTPRQIQELTGDAQACPRMTTSNRRRKSCRSWSRPRWRYRTGTTPPAPSSLCLYRLACFRGPRPSPIVP